MKILSADKIREADIYTIEHEPIRDIDLMERAASRCFEWILGHCQRDSFFWIYAGTGNNGGDGLAIARMLHGSGFRTRVFMADGSVRVSPSCRINIERYTELPGCDIVILKEDKAFQDHRAGVIIIDALFGSGLDRPVTGFPARIIDHINQSGNEVIAIDVPSGLFIDENSTEAGHSIIRARHTLTFAPPKFGFFFPENDCYIGDWHLLDIGLSREFINLTEVKRYCADIELVAPILRNRSKFSHKGDYGHALLVAGSEGKGGAAILAARACLRSGAGLVTVKSSPEIIPVIQAAFPEAMCTRSTDYTLYRSIGAGPGMGQTDESAAILKQLIQDAVIPLVVDADALNILSQHKTWLKFLPPGTILTPHPGEFERLAGKWKNDFDRHDKQLEMSFSCQVYIVLKGAHTCITTPDGRAYFNMSGNPGMATAGSGDVLTGIITSLLAQGYTATESCLLGVFLHGLSGDLAAASVGEESLIAGDIIHNLGNAFRLIHGKL